MISSSSRGQTSNYFAAILVLFFFGFTSILSWVIFSGFITQFTATGYYTGLTEQTGNAILSTLQMFDLIIVFIMVATIIAIGLTSYRLNTSMGFFIVSIIMASFTGFISYVFNYVFLQFISTDAVNAALVHFPRTILVCTNLHWVALMLFVVGSITLYAKREKGEGGVFVDD